MRPPRWHPPVELSTAAQAILKRSRRVKWLVFLRQHRHALFAEALQQELLTLYKDQPQGHPPVPPAQLALATLLQAYTQGSDDEVSEATTMDRRWQGGLDCLSNSRPVGCFILSRHVQPATLRSEGTYRVRLGASYQQPERWLPCSAVCLADASRRRLHDSWVDHGPLPRGPGLDRSPLWTRPGFVQVDHQEIGPSGHQPHVHRRAQRMPELTARGRRQTALL